MEVPPIVTVAEFEAVQREYPILLSKAAGGEDPTGDGKPKLPTLPNTPGGPKWVGSLGFGAVVDADDLNEIAAYGGFPTRYPHW